MNGGVRAVTWLTLVALLPVAGCSMPGTRVEVAPTSNAPGTNVSFEFRDARSERDKAGGRGATGHHGRFLGDDVINPPPPELLKRWLQDRLATELAGKRVILTQFVVQVLDSRPGGASSLARAAEEPGSIIFNPVGSLALSVIALTHEAASTNDQSVIVRIAGSVDGKPLRASNSVSGAGGAALINAAVVGALDDAVANVKAILQPAPPVRRERKAQDGDDDHVNCISGGERRWVMRRDCD